MSGRGVVSRGNPKGGLYIEFEEIADEIVNLADIIPVDLYGDSQDLRGFVERQILATQRIIDAYCAGKYTVPFRHPIPRLVQQITRDLTCYRILRQVYVQEDPALSAWVDSYKLAMEMLKEIQVGTLSLSPDSQADAAGGPAIVSRTAGYDAEFTETKRIGGRVVQRGTMEGV